MTANPNHLAYQLNVPVSEANSILTQERITRFKVQLYCPLNNELFFHEFDMKQRPGEIIHLKSVGKPLENYEGFSHKFTKIAQEPQFGSDLIQYHDVLIPKTECAVLNNLNRFLRGTIPIPHKNTLEPIKERTGRIHYVYGFTTENNHVTGLGLADKVFDKLIKLYFPDLSDLTQLKVLQLDKTQLTAFPTGIEKLKNLRELTMSYNELVASSIPESIGNLKKLETLQLNNNKIVLLPNGITNLQNLKKLDLSNNLIVSFTEAQKKWLDDLKTNGCDLHYNLTSHLPYEGVMLPVDEFFVLKTLEKQLGVKVIESTGIPHRGIIKKNRLYYSIITRNLSPGSRFSRPHGFAPKVTTAYYQYGSSFNKAKVAGISLHSKKLLNLPECIKDLNDLQELSLDNNNLSSLPNWVCNFNLTALDLRLNQFTTLPDWFNQLTSLEFLCLSHNQFDSLPNWFDQLKSLEILDIANNRFSNLPKVLISLTNLTQLGLSNNQFLPFSPAITSWLNELENTGCKIHGRPVFSS